MSLYTLYDYFRSSAAFRVRIALFLKQLPFASITIHLTKNGGEQHSPSYKMKNPQGLVPLLEDHQEQKYICQSLSIIEYLEEKHPQYAILPQAPLDRAYVRTVANMIACDIHPLNNLRILQYLENTLKISEEEKSTWYHHWVAKGFQALETFIRTNAAMGKYCFGDTPTLADIYLIPQMYNAKRFACSLEPYPSLNRIYDYCMNQEAFIQAAPENQMVS